MFTIRMKYEEEEGGFLMYFIGVNDRPVMCLNFNSWIDMVVTADNAEYANNIDKVIDETPRNLRTRMF